MHAISVKELRQKFPFVRSELAKGTTFLIIHKSEAIAELKPIHSENSQFSIEKTEEYDEDLSLWENAGVVDANRALEAIGDFGLSEEEIKYYKSLPQPDDKLIR